MSRRSLSNGKLMRSSEYPGMQILPMSTNFPESLLLSDGTLQNVPLLLPDSSSDQQSCYYFSGISPNSMQESQNGTAVIVVNPNASANAINHSSISTGRSPVAKEDRRKSTHNEVERRRRSRINNSMDLLSKIVPDCNNEEGPKIPQCKSIVLEKAVEHIKNLQAENVRLQFKLKEMPSSASDTELQREVHDLRLLNEELRSSLERVLISDHSNICATCDSQLFCLKCSGLLPTGLTISPPGLMGSVNPLSPSSPSPKIITDGRSLLSKSPTALDNQLSGVTVEQPVAKRGRFSPVHEATSCPPVAQDLVTPSLSQISATDLSINRPSSQNSVAPETQSGISDEPIQVV